jgi:hypothetical protein
VPFSPFRKRKAQNLGYVLSSTPTREIQPGRDEGISIRPFGGMHGRGFATLCGVCAESGAVPRRSHGGTCFFQSRRTRLNSDGDSIDVEEEGWRAPRRCYRVILLLGTAIADGKISSPHCGVDHRPCCENLTLVPLG